MSVSINALRGTIRAAALIAVAGYFAMGGGASARPFAVLHDFCTQTNCTDGKMPGGELLKDGTGTLYGTASGGGAHQGGNVYELVPNGTGYDFHALYDFCALSNCVDGLGPTGPLIIDADGNLYGTTVAGGPSDYGTAYELVRRDGRRGWKLVTLFHFCNVSFCADGATPLDGLTYSGAQSGAPYDGISPLYGTTQGVIYAGSSFAFSLVKTPHQTLRQENILSYFCPAAGCAWNDEPGALIDDGAGNFYGAAYSGGSAGFVFELIGGGNTLTLQHLYDFCQQTQCIDGVHPESVTRDGAGNLFGITPFGGANGKGTIFKLVPGKSRWRQSVVHDFCSGQPNCSDGGNPGGTLTLDANGELLGTAANGGKCAGGTLFRQGQRAFKRLHDFCRGNGFDAYSHLLVDSSGAIYGTATDGGRYGGGTVFRLMP